MFKKFIIISVLLFSFLLIPLISFGYNSEIKNGNYNLLAGTDLTKPDFEIDVSTITPGSNQLKKGTVKDTVNNVLGTIVQKLMIAIGSISLLVMTIGAGYMIFYHGQDELLSKGKSIFISGLIALLVALASYYIVSLIRFILYSGS